MYHQPATIIIKSTAWLGPLGLGLVPPETAGWNPQDLGPRVAPSQGADEPLLQMPTAECGEDYVPLRADQHPSQYNTRGSISHPAFEDSGPRIHSCGGSRRNRPFERRQHSPVIRLRTPQRASSCVLRTLCPSPCQRRHPWVFDHRQGESVPRIPVIWVHLRTLTPPTIAHKRMINKIVPCGWA